MTTHHARVLDEIHMGGETPTYGAGMDVEEKGKSGSEGVRRGKRTVLLAWVIRDRRIIHTVETASILAA